MTYGRVRDESLKLINSYSSAGQTIPASYNNQADLLKMIPGLVYSCEMEIATTVRKIPASIELSRDHFQIRNAELGMRNYEFRLPEDCWQIFHGGLLDLSRGAPMRYSRYRLFGDKIILPADAPEGLILEYYRYPKKIGTDPKDGLKLDNTPDTHPVIPYYVASHLVMYDDTYRYAVLYSEYEKRLSRLGTGIFVEENVIPDAYDWVGGFNGY